jgi:protein involved in polysaccharide export with SLBB domain
MRSTIAAMTLMATMSMPALAQSRPTSDPTGLELSRTELQELLTQYEETAASSAYSGSLRRQAESQATLIRHRLEAGDLNVGDRVLLEVQGHVALSDTFTVVAGRQIVLPDLGPIPLSGVLRSELQQHLTEQVGRFIRNPVIRTRSLIRVEILGAVGRPGFFTIPSDILLGDALMIAGGPGGGARLDNITIKRGRTVLWSGDQLRQEMLVGRTLDQLNLRAGDTIEVPARVEGRMRRYREAMYVITGVASLIALGSRIF